MRECKYHDFKLIGQDAVSQGEECKLCGYVVTYRKVDGKIDNVKYLKDHIRDFCQSTGDTSKIFEEIYGVKAVARSIKAKDSEGEFNRAFNEGIDDTKEALKFWERMKSKGFTDKEIIRMIDDI